MLTFLKMLFHQIGYIGQQSQVASALNSLSYAALELERSASDAARKDFTLLVEELFEEFRILVVDILDTASLETAVFFLFHVH